MYKAGNRFICNTYSLDLAYVIYYTIAKLLNKLLHACNPTVCVCLGYYRLSYKTPLRASSMAITR